MPACAVCMHIYMYIMYRGKYIHTYMCVCVCVCIRACTCVSGGLKLMLVIFVVVFHYKVFEDGLSPDQGLTRQLAQGMCLSAFRGLGSWLVITSVMGIQTLVFIFIPHWVISLALEFFIVYWKVNSRHFRQLDLAILLVYFSSQEKRLNRSSRSTIFNCWVEDQMTVS